MRQRNIPNLVSVFRIILIIPFIWALTVHEYRLALILFTVAGISDGVDGFLAKRFHWQSRLGSILDPVADKLLLVASFATLSWLGLLPIWLFWLVIARDVIIVSGALGYHYCFGEYEMAPLWSSKINTAFQISLVLLVLIRQDGLNIIDPFVKPGIWLVVASIIISGSEYILVWGEKAWTHNKAKK